MLKVSSRVVHASHACLDVGQLRFDVTLGPAMLAQ